MTTDDVPAPLIGTALRCRCPRCGIGRVYTGYLRVADRCPQCGLALASNDSADGPAVFLMFIIGGLSIPLALWIGAALSLPNWAFVAIAAGLIVAMTLALLPPAKALVLALQYRHRPEDFGDGAG